MVVIKVHLKATMIHRVALYFYAVKDRIPRVYPWMNEPGAGILGGWNMSAQGTVYIISNTTLYGCVNTGAGS